MDYKDQYCEDVHVNKCHSYPDDNIIICENRIIIMIKKTQYLKQLWGGQVKPMRGQRRTEDDSIPDLQIHWKMISFQTACQQLQYMFTDQWSRIEISDINFS